MLGTIRYLFCTLFLLYFCFQPLWAQNHADCVGARPICGSQTVTLESTSIGDVRDVETDNFGCMSWGETGTVWYKFEIGQAGWLTFTITPAEASDYDWALWGPFTKEAKPCGGGLGSPLRCNASGENVPTGLSIDAPNASEPGGVGVNPWSKFIVVEKGQVYYLVLDNCSLSRECNNSSPAQGSAFRLSWGGTARLASIEGDYTISQTCRTANFQTNITSCYTDLRYRWDLGDGTTSNLQNPTHTYLHEGTYTTKLTIWSATDSAASVISFPEKTVSIRSAAMFSTPFSYTQTCKQLKLNAPTSCLTNISEYEWDMGDGKPATKTTVPTLDYTYDLPNTYTVGLKIRTTDGAIFTTTGSVIFTEPSFDVDFENSKNCKETLFKAKVLTCKTGLTYFWDLGNGQTSPDPNVSVFYTAQQNYSVSLKVRAGDGTEKTVSKNYLYENPKITVDFETTKNCEKTTFKALTSTCLTNPLTYFWDLGNGQTSTLPTVSVFYTAEQNYTVKLKVRSETDNIENEISKPYTYENPAINANFEAIIKCKEVQFNDQTSTCLFISSYFWEFGDGKTSTERNPKHEYTEENKTFKARLTVKTNNGLEKIIEKNVVIPKLLTAVFKSEIRCKNVVFTNQSQSCDPDAEYYWEFGNGLNSSAKNPTHLYTENGTYNVFLTVTTKNGLKETYQETIRLSTADFSAFISAKQNCTAMDFEAVVPDCYEVTYFWELGDGKTSTAKKLTHNYAKYGSYNVKLKVVNSFGQTIQINKTVVLTAPQIEGEFDFTVPTDKCREVHFKNTLKSCAELRFQWFVLDQTGKTVAESQAANPKISLPKEGNYLVTLTVVNADGSLLEYKKTITIEPPFLMNISGLAAEYDIDDSPVTLQGTPAGGKFFVDNKEFAQLQFSEIGIGTKALDYRIFDQDRNCTFITTTSFKVNPLPFITIDTLQHIFCPNDAVFLLKGTPKGGRFTLNSDTTAISEINPAFLSAGFHQVHYALTDPKRTVISSAFITVRAVPKLYFSNIVNDSIRIDQPPFDALPLPAGGKMLIGKDTTQKIDPKILGLGLHRFQYFFQDTNQCLTVLDKKILVYPAPEIQFLNVSERFCTNDKAFFLSATPAGGQFFLDGNLLEKNYFDPKKIGIGEYSLLYRFVDRHNVPLELSKNIKIFESPKPKIENLENKKEVCLNAEGIKLEGSPSGKGGYFKVDNRKTELFYPAVWGAGAHKITYIYTNENNCTDSISQFVTVNPPPFITILNLQKEYCGTDTNRILLKGLPEGGKFSLNGTFMSVLIPSIWGSGRIKVEYVFKDEKNCTWTSSHHVQILETPKLQILGLQKLYCLNDTPPFVPKANLDSGVWELAGKKITKIEPQRLGAGKFDLKYIFIDSNRCTVTTTETLHFVENPKFELNHKKGDGCYRTDTLRVRMASFFRKKITWKNPKSFVAILHDTIAVVNRTGVYAVSVLDSITGCRTEDSVKIIINPLPKVEIPDVPYLCYGTSRSLDAGAGFKAYSWRDSAGTELSVNQFLTVSIAQKYTVMVMNQFGCTASDTFRVAKILPMISVRISGDSTICEDENQAILVADKGFVRYEWRFGKEPKWENTQSDNRFFAKRLGVHWLRATDKWGCIAEDSIVVNDCCEPLVEMPNAFTPHHSAGANDLYRVKHLNIKHFKLQIYNRWGLLIFETNDPEVGWDGMYEGQKMPSDAYQVIVEYHGCNQKGEIRRRKTEALHLVD